MNNVKKQTPVIIFFALLIIVTLIVGIVIFTPLKSRNISELIQPVNLVAGETDTLIINDLFYAENYDLNFSKNENVDIIYSENKLILHPNENFEGADLLEFEYGTDKFFIPVFCKSIQKKRFTFKAPSKYKKIHLFGVFNSWNRSNLEMSDGDGDGIYEIEIPLLPGQYQYKFYCEGDELLDPDNNVRVPNGLGDFNNVINVEPKFKDKSHLHIFDITRMGHQNKLIFAYENSNPKTFVRDDDVVALLDNKKIYSDNIFTGNNRIEISLDPSQLLGKHRLRVVVDKNGQLTNMQEIILENGIPLNINKNSWQDGTIYSLMVDRFNDGDKSLNNPVVHDSLLQKANYYGGDLQGIINKLSENYFTDLGVNILWISPVYDNPNIAFKEYPAPHRWYSGYHGYWPIHHKKVEEKFGDMEKLKELISVAHSKNIKVLLDFVSNHVHQEHPFYAEHKDWFGKLELPDGRLNLRHWDEFRLTTWFEPYLPSFDYENSPEALEAMTENALWWLKETGADGYRHDAVKHVPNSFWRALTKKIKKEIEKPNEVEVYQIGETFGSYELVGSYVNHGQLSSQFNFELYNVAQAAFIDPDRSFADLSAELQKTNEFFGPLHLMGNIMDSHDKNRFIAYADGDLSLSEWSAIELGWNNPPKVNHSSSYDKALLYYAYMFTIPGLPVVYYGSEFGMSGASDPDNRRMMRFDDQLSDDEKAMLKQVQEISKIRNEHSALRYGDLYTLQADENIFAYVRSDFNERILVVINKSEKSQNIELKLPEFYKAKSLANLADDSKIEIENNKIVLNSEPISFKIFNISK